MATTPTPRQDDRQAAIDLLVKPSRTTKLDMMKYSSFSNTLGLQSDDLRQTILEGLTANRPDKGYNVDEAAQIAENISKDKTIEWPFLDTYQENVGHMVARSSLTEQSTRLLEILKDNPIDSFEKPSPTLMDYGQTLLMVELHQPPNISATEQLPSLLRGIEAAAHHNAYDQYHSTFNETTQPHEDYMDIGIEAKERTKPFIEAVYNDPKINRNINSSKKSFYDLSTGPDGLLKDKNVSDVLFPEYATEYEQKVLIDAIDTLPYSAQQEAAESLMLSREFGIDFTLEQTQNSLNSLMGLRDRTYPTAAADDLSQQELFSEAMVASMNFHPAPNVAKSIGLSKQADVLLHVVMQSDLAETADLSESQLREGFREIESKMFETTSASRMLPVLLQHVNNTAMDSIAYLPAGVDVMARTDLLKQQTNDLTRSAYTNASINYDSRHGATNGLYDSDISDLVVDGVPNRAFFHPDATNDTNLAITKALETLSPPAQQVAFYGLKSTAEVGTAKFDQKNTVSLMLMDFDAHNTYFGISKNPSAKDSFDAIANAVPEPTNNNIHLHSPVDPVLGSTRVNNALDALNKDYAELSKNAQFGNVSIDRLVNDSMDLFKKADDFGRMANEIVANPSGSDVSPQTLDDALKGVSDYVDEAAHIAQFVTHNSDSMMEVRSQSRAAMTSMDDHRQNLAAHIQTFDNTATNSQLSPIERDLKNDYANNMLAGINKDFDDLSKRAKDANPDINMISNKGLDFLDSANSFSNVINAIADKSRGDQDYQQELKDTLKDISAYVDDASHNINHVNHNTDDMNNMLDKTRAAMEGMDKHREMLDTTITNFNEPAPAPVAAVENTDNAPAVPRR